MKRLFCVLGLFLLVLMIGCQSAPVGGTKKATSRARTSAKVDWDSLEVVGYLALGSSAADRLALEVMEPRLEIEFMKLELPFILMRPSEVAAAASRHDVGQVHEEMVAHWRDSKKVNKLKLQSLCETLGLDAVLVANIEEWDQVQAVPGSTEPGYTRISMITEIWPAGASRRGWRERTSESWDAAQLRDHDADAERDAPGVVPTDGAGSEPPRFMAGSEAPRFEEVADDVAQKAAKKLGKAAGL